MSVTSNYLIKFSNFATTSLRDELLRAQTVVRVRNGSGRNFPDIDTEKGEYFMLVLMNPVGNNWEIVKVVEKFTGPTDVPDQQDSFRIMRAQEGTVAQYFPGAVVR